MVRATPILTSFNAGEWDPELAGSFDLAKYANACRTLENFIGKVRRSAGRRPGSRFIAATAADAAGAEQQARLIDFVYSIVQAYVIEATAFKFRFYRNRALIGSDAAELIVNGEFAADLSGWTDLDSGAAQSLWDAGAGGRLRQIRPTGGTCLLRQEVAIVEPGRLHKLSQAGSGARQIRVGTAAGLADLLLLTPDAGPSASAGSFTPAASPVFIDIVTDTVAESFTDALSLKTAVEIATPYAESELAALKWTQSADVLYLTHRAHEPQTLTRFSHVDWRRAPFGAVDGPYDDENTTSAQLQPSATSGDGITITTGPPKTISGAIDNGSGLIRITSTGHGWTTGMRLLLSAVTGTVEANGIWTVTRIDNNRYDLQGSKFVNAYVAGGSAVPAIFVASDVGRLVRIKNGASWGHAEITAVVDAGRVTADVIAAFAAITGNRAWRLGAWSNTTGFPTAVAFYEERLWFARGQTLWGSRTGDFQTFAPTQADGTVLDDDAVTYTLSDAEVNEIVALEPGDTLLAITNSGPFSISASALNEAITPTNVKAQRVGTVGAADQMTVRIGTATLMVERSLTQLYELVYRFDLGTNGAYVMPELTELARHLTAAGLAQIVWQQNPDKLLWAVRADGMLLAMTYARDQDIVGWHRHPIGGAHLTAAAVARPFGKVLAAATIPGATQDELWLVVERNIAGRTRRYVEVLESEFRPRTIDDKDAAWFVDSGLAYDGAQPTTLIPGAGAATKGAADVIFSAGAGVFAGSVVGREIHYPYDLQVGRALRTKRARAKITAADSASVVRAAILEPFPAAPATLAANSWRLSAQTLSGLDHLEGQTVQILADGATHPDRVVAGGQVALERQAGRAQVGLACPASLETLNLEGLAKLAARKRFANGAIKFLNSLGAKFGTDFDRLETIPFRATTDPLDSSPPLFTGDKKILFADGFADEQRAIVQQDLPLPCTVVAIGLDMEANSG